MGTTLYNGVIDRNRISESDQNDIDQYNALYGHLDGVELLEAVFKAGLFQNIMATSSFGVEAAIPLHMISQIAPNTPVVFTDTEMHFPDTLRYRDELTDTFNLTNVISLKPNQTTLALYDPNNRIHEDTDPESTKYDGMNGNNACCDIRKTQPLHEHFAQNSYDAWITGRKRIDGGSRSNLMPFGGEIVNGKFITKINPFWNWDDWKIIAYFIEHDLPHHPKAEAGYASVGCMPFECTALSDTRRGGRWAGQSMKLTCGMHSGTTT